MTGAGRDAVAAALAALTSGAHRPAGGGRVAATVCGGNVAAAGVA